LKRVSISLKFYTKIKKVSIITKKLKKKVIGLTESVRGGSFAEVPMLLLIPFQVLEKFAGCS
jgi:hypothetical protein